MVDSREQFVPGNFRSELRIAIPQLRGDDIEWIVSAVISELQASRDSAIEECAAGVVEILLAMDGTNWTYEDVADALRALKGKE
jgi:hypothetical protein